MIRITAEQVGGRWRAPCSHCRTHHWFERTGEQTARCFAPGAPLRGKTVFVIERAARRRR